MAFKKGDRIHAEFPAVIKTDNSGRDATTRVAETGKFTSWNHLLFLSDKTSRKEILKEGADADTSIGSTITVSFDAVITGDLRAGPSVTTEVTTAAGFVHYMYLDSPSVTAVKDPEPAAYKTGDRIRAGFEAEIEAGGGDYSTSRVREIRDGTIHYLYLRSADAREQVLKPGTYSGRPGDGDRITVSFDAEITGRIEDGQNLTTVVKTGDSPRENRFTHLVYLASPSITPVKEPEPAAYKTGDRLDIRITGIVKTNGEVNATSQVREGAYVHYLYLAAPGIRDDGTLIPIGGTADADFTARIIDDGKRPPAGTIAVKDDFTFIHYVDPASPSVTPAGTTSSGRSSDMAADREYVTRQIAELEKKAAWEVVRDRTGDRLKTFSTEAEARQFLTDEDYNPDRFTIQQKDLDDGGRKTLEALRAAEYLLQLADGSVTPKRKANLLYAAGVLAGKGPEGPNAPEGYPQYIVTRDPGTSVTIDTDSRKPFTLETARKAAESRNGRVTGDRLPYRVFALRAVD